MEKWPPQTLGEGERKGARAQKWGKGEPSHFKKNPKTKEGGGEGERGRNQDRGRGPRGEGADKEKKEEGEEGGTNPEEGNRVF